jgi:TetR/AcrR family transcriptional repressor of nem operon
VSPDRGLGLEGTVTVLTAPPTGAGHRPRIVAQLEGQVLFAKLYNDTRLLDVLWTNSLLLLGTVTHQDTSTAA